MSIRSWNKTWGTLIPLLQKKAESEKEITLIDKKIEHEIINQLLNKADINDVSPIIQCTFLHLCVGKGLVKSSKLLIQRGADIQKTNRFHEKPADYIEYAQFNKEELKKLFLSPFILSHKKSRE